MRPDETSELTPDAFFLDRGAVTDSAHALGEEDQGEDVGPAARPPDPTTPPQGGDRDATRRRTRELLSRVGDATPEEHDRIRDEVVTLHLWLASSAARSRPMRPSIISLGAMMSAPAAA